MDVMKIRAIVKEAKTAAFDAADTFFKERLNGVDQYACGFAWVSIYEFQGKKLDGRTKIGKAMKAAGVDTDYQKIFQIWNPSGYRCQNVDTLEAGARAAAEVFKKHGFVAGAGSRLD